VITLCEGEEAIAKQEGEVIGRNHTGVYTVAKEVVEVHWKVEVEAYKIYIRSKNYKLDNTCVDMAHKH
jgi:hypothetical protein